MLAIQIIAVIFMAGWFAAMGATRKRLIMAPLWALLGVVIWAVGFYVGAWIVEQILLTAGPAIAANGVNVVSKLVGIGVGIGACYLFYRLRVIRQTAAVT